MSRSLRKAAKRRTTRNVLDISRLALSTVQSTAERSDVREFNDVARAALAIYDAAQRARDSRRAMTRLAADACGVVFAVLYNHGNRTVIEAQVLEHVRELLGLLSSVERFTTTEISRNFFVRKIRRRYSRAKIQEFREILQQSHDTFKSQFAMQDNMQQSVACGQHAEVTVELVEQQQKHEAEKTRTENGRNEQGASPAPDSLLNRTLLKVRSGSSVAVTVNQIITDASLRIINTNSANTTTTTTKGAYNDSSVYTNRAARRHGEKRAFRYSV